MTKRNVEMHFFSFRDLITEVLKEENRDFKKFINSIMEDIKLGKVKSEYDEIN